MEKKRLNNEVVPMSEREADWSAAEAELANGYVENAELTRQLVEEFRAIDQEGFGSIPN